MADSSRWTTHGTRRVYASPWVNVDLDDVEVPGGQRFEHHVLRFPRASVGAVVVDADRVLLLWRHRFATDLWGWEIPAGWSDDGEDPADAARREVLEETGYRVSTVEPLTTYAPMAGISSHLYRVFVATGATLVGEPEAAEADRVEWVPLAEVPKLMTAGQVPDGPSVTALAFYLATR
ncbi:NUDIX hydrolase [Kutzneria buriramensis]|uniref:ADP-ribose pyrophosphatase YjhB (NUDIX family) n=1 Tax=Kutzneria buriramensis TaxID=1045776 RepID=A0A3E0GU73_9PSEU|nr:NUDIX hydrolase [Kutzneria buriramensis]REH25981.1 ADP-ribose pyrophosphatase YjhB (NUDIX family) [Kutzneria buriramensis]